MATELKTVSQVVAFGRSMIQYSENFKELHKLDNAQLDTLNKLSVLGNRLTRVGTAYGPKPEEFTEQEMALMEQFAQGNIQIDQEQV